jgi:glyoxylase-like metal-dependent hydrolase (beta-lactamase superfamily II)
MIEILAHGDVTQLRMSSRRSRLAGFSVSAYLVRDVLVDTGFPAIGEELARWLDATPAVRGAIVTHRHEDHAGNVALLAARALPLAMSAATRAAVRDVGPIGFYRRFTWQQMTPLPPTAPELDPAPLALVATPGHSSDHHAVWDAERETLFAGDLFLGVRVRVAHPGENPRLLAASLRTAAALAPRRLFDAHRGPVRDPVALLTAKADWIDETVHAIERRLADGWSDHAVRREVLGREEWAGYVSRGDYSRTNFVRAVRAGMR